jgi:hypothetical protein
MEEKNKKNNIQKDDDERRVLGDELEDDYDGGKTSVLKLTIVCLSDFVYDTVTQGGWVTNDSESHGGAGWAL